MKKTSLNILQHKIALRRLKLLLICLMALALVSCGDPFPAKFMYEIDIKNQTCGVYKIIDEERVLVEHFEDRPLSACDGVFGFSTEDTPKVMNWTRDVIKDAKEKK